MFVDLIQTNDPKVKLVSPKIEDAKTSLGWVSGAEGRALLTLMGNNVPDNWRSTLEEEQNRIKDFLEKDDQLNWAIEVSGVVVGSVWLDLRPDRTIGPHIMIGDPQARGKGVGETVLRTIIEWALKTKTGELQKYNFKELITRCKTDNTPVVALNKKLGFEPVGAVYREDNFEWQQYRITRLL